MSIFKRKIEVTTFISKITKPIFADVTKDHAYYNIHFDGLEKRKGIPDRIVKMEQMTDYRKDLEWIKEGEVLYYTYERAPNNKEKFILNNPYKFNIGRDVNLLTENKGNVLVKIKDRNVKNKHYYYCYPKSLKDRILGLKKIEKLYTVVINKSGIILNDIRENHLTNKELKINDQNKTNN